MTKIEDLHRTKFAKKKQKHVLASRNDSHHPQVLYVKRKRKYATDKICQQGCVGVVCCLFSPALFRMSVRLQTMTRPLLRFNEQLFSKFHPVSSTLPLLSKVTRTPADQARANERHGSSIGIMCVHVERWHVSNTRQTLPLFHIYHLLPLPPTPRYVTS